MSHEFPDIHWVFFDVGYTLFDETPAWHDRFEAVAVELRRRGRDVSIDTVWHTYREACEQFDPLQWLGVIKRLSRSDAEATELASLSTGWNHKLEIAYPGVDSLLQSLHQRYKLGVIANQSAGTAERLQERGLLRHIDLVIGSAEAGVRKPDPKIFQMALLNAGCSASAAVMVGDRIDNDIAPAKALGMKTIHVRQGGGGLQIPRSLAETADATVDRITNIAGLLPI